MIKRKKKNTFKDFVCILVFALSCILLSPICGSADAGFTVGFANNFRTLNIRGNISGAKDSYVSVTVLNLGIDYDDYIRMSDSDKSKSVKCLKQIKADENGAFSTSIKFNGENGFYTVVVGGGGEISSQRVYYEHMENDIDEMTTTEYAPWMLQYHLTTKDQYESGYRGGEGGQKGFSLAYSPIDEDLLFFGTDTSGVWKSTDGGANWRISSSGLSCFGTVGLICGKNDKDVVYVAACPNVSPDLITQQTGIYASYDGGATWKQEVKTGYLRKYSVSLFAYLGDTLYAVSHDGGVYCTSGNGSWTKVYTYNGTINNIIESEGKLILSTSDNGILISSDGGKTWTQKSGFDTNYVMCTAVDPTNPSRWACVTKNTLYTSTDGGEKWTAVKTCGKIRSGSKDAFGGLFFGAKYGNYPRLYVQIYSVAGPLSYSDDFGTTFKNMTINTKYGFMYNKTGYSCEPIRVNPHNLEELMSCMDAELYKSIDGGKSFFASSSGFSGLRAMDISFNPADNNDMLISLMDFGAAHVYNSGMGEAYPLAEYVYLRYNSKGASRSIDRDPFNSNHILVNVGQSSAGFIVKESFDGGKTFSDISATAGYDTTIIRFNKEKEGVIYAKDIISYDGGVTWTKSQYKIYAVSAIDGNIVYGIGDSKIYKSADMGKTWSYLYPISSGWQSVTSDYTKLDKLYVGFFSGGFRTYDNGTYTVTNKSTDGYSMEYIYCVAQDPQNYLHLLAGGANNSLYMPTEGIFESYDGGKSWYKVNGLPFGRDIWKIQFHPNLSRAYITTSSGTYIYNYLDYKDGNVVVKNISKTEEDESDKYYYRLYNVTEEYQNVKIISATYDANGNLIPGTVNIENMSVSPMNNVEGYKYQSKESGQNTKIFFWKDMSTITPYNVINY